MSASRLLRIVRRHATGTVVETQIEGLRLFRITTRVERLAAVAQTGICVIVQGSKRTYYGRRAHRYDSEKYLCCSLPLPVETEVPAASSKRPVLGVLLDMDTPAVVEAVVKLSAHTAHLARGSAHEVPGLCLAPRDAAFDEALARLIELLDDDAARTALVYGRLQEVIFEVLRGEAGPSVRRALGPDGKIARAISYLSDSLTEPVSVDHLARRAAMSRGTFYRRFKAATAHSPIQFLKVMRLNRAAMLLTSGRSVGETAKEVGYVSQSQFSREFRRQFGKTPREWSEANPSPS